MPKRNYAVQPKERHKRVARKMAENGRKSLGEILKSEGYSKSAQEAPTKVTKTKGFQIAQKDVLDELKAERQRIMDAMIKKIGKASYGVLSMARKSVQDHIWEAEDRLKEGGKPPDRVIVEFH